MPVKQPSLLLRISTWLLRVVFVGMVSYNLWFYFRLNRALSAMPGNIAYTYLSKRNEAGGKSGSYIVALIYKGRPYKAHITYNAFKASTEANPPELYYSPGMDIVFSKWELKRAARLSLVFTVFFGLSFFPWQKWEKQLKS